MGLATIRWGMRKPSTPPCCFAAAPVAAIARLLLALLLVGPAPAAAQPSGNDGEWRTYGGQGRGAKYSPLDQIDAQNVGDLRTAWRWRSVDYDLVDDKPGPALQPHAARHAADGGRPAVHEHQPRAIRGDRPGHRRDAVGLPRAGRRRGPAARRLHPRRRLLARPGPGRRAHLHRQRRATRGARRQDRQPDRRVRRGRQGESDDGHPGPRGVSVERPAAGLPRHRHRRRRHPRRADEQGAGARLHPRVRRGHRPAEVAVQPGAAGRASRATRPGRTAPGSTPAPPRSGR